MRSLRSNSVTWWPALFSCAAAAMPAGPEPMTATLRPVRNAGGSGWTHPFSKAWSMMRCSICLIVTASSLMSSTHAASHGAGQMRPVNSGKLFVACSASIALRQRSRKTRSFQSGMRLPSGQPEWQKGMPQSMHRAPCCWSSGSASGSAYSSKSSTRSATGRLRASTRWISRKPPSLPMAREHLLLAAGLRLGLRRLVGPRSSRGITRSLRRDVRVLMLPGLAQLTRLLAAVARHVRRRLPRADRPRAVAVAALGHLGELAGLDRLLLGELAERALVVHRHDLDPGAAQSVPVVERALGHRRVRPLEVLLHERAHLVEVLVLELLELDQLGVALGLELVAGVQHVCDAARHARGEVAPGGPEHDHAAAGHVLAAVVAHALDDRLYAGVADAEALAREAAEERPAGGGAVQHRVADHHVLLGDERRALGRAHGEHAAGHALAGVVVGVAVELDGHAAHQPAAEALATVSVRADADGVVGQALVAVAARDLAREQAADATVLILHPGVDLNALAVLEGGLRLLDELVVAVVVEDRVLRAHAAARDLGTGLRRLEQPGEVHSLRLPVLDRLVRLEQVGA